MDRRHDVSQSRCCFVLSFLLSLLTKSAFDALSSDTVANLTGSKDLYTN